MPFFKDSDEMYQVHRALFDYMSSHPEIGARLAKSKLIIRFEVSDPEGVITVNCRDTPLEEGKFVSYTCGNSDLTPDITFKNSSDFSHEFWHGKVNVMSALLSGRTKARGSIPKALKILPIIKPVFKKYPEILRQINREDLIIK
jgi:hypothetical protein